MILFLTIYPKKVTGYSIWNLPIRRVRDHKGAILILEHLREHWIYGYIRAPLSVIETALIYKLKASVIHDRVGLGLNLHHIDASPCPSPLGHARPKCHN